MLTRNINTLGNFFRLWKIFAAGLFIPLWMLMFLLNSGWAETTLQKPVRLDDWRLPTNEELKRAFDDPVYWTKRFIITQENLKEPALGKGDFNGDRLTDEVKFMLKKDGSSLGLIVVFSSEKNKTEGILLDTLPTTFLGAMGITIYEPGKYRVTCFEEKLCEDHGKQSIVIDTASIDYYKPESASSIFVWNKKESRFDRIWESD